MQFWPVSENIREMHMSPNKSKTLRTSPKEVPHQKSFFYAPGSAFLIIAGDIIVGYRAQLCTYNQMKHTANVTNTAIVAEEVQAPMAAGTSY